MAIVIGSNGKEYQVNYNETLLRWECSCADFIWRNKGPWDERQCKHIRQYLLTVQPTKETQP